MANVKRTKVDVAAEMLRLANEGHPMTSTQVPTYLVRSAQTYFGSWKNAINELGIKQTRKRYRETDATRKAYEDRRRWSDAAIAEALRQSSVEGITPMEFRSRYGPMGDAIDRRFGGVLHACDCFGIKRLPRDDIDPYKFAGHSFEEVLGEIFAEIGISYVKERFGDCVPDFASGTAWYDAKLSENTFRFCDTVEKYEPNCESLTIVFLRGNPKTDRYISDKTRLVHVSYYLNRLPELKKVYYQKKLKGILTTLDAQVSKAA